jgi:hypothetical protein
MSRHMPEPFQYDRPVFVRIPFRAQGRDWKKGQELKWKELSLDSDKILILYTQGYLIHSTDLESTLNVGDGLEVMNLASLHSVVKSINDKVRKKIDSDLEFNRKKCKTSQLLDKQRGLIRSWRRTFGKLEAD